MQNSMVIFIFSIWKYPFCVNFNQKFKIIILNLVLTLRCLIDDPPTPPPSANYFFVFFLPEHSFSSPLPLPTYQLLEKVFNPSLKRYTFADFFAILQKDRPVGSVFCFASQCKETNTVFFVSQYKEVNLLPINDLISQK